MHFNMLPFNEGQGFPYFVKGARSCRIIGFRNYKIRLDAIRQRLKWLSKNRF